MRYINHNDREFNIIHFQGKCKRERADVYNEIYNEYSKINNIDELTVVTVFTDDIDSKIYKQMVNNKIKVINCYIPTEKPWVNQYKLFCISKALKNVKTRYVLVLDGSDTLVLTFDKLIEKFEQTGYRILFNGTKNNWPNIMIDQVSCRSLLGEYMFFNAGCCLGYTKDVCQFYNESMKYYNIENPANSEQVILRHNFANYSKDPTNKFVFFDYNCDIFQTIGASTLDYIGNNTVKIK